MPRDVNGVFMLVPGTAAVTGEVIDSSDYNALTQDIAADLNVARPITAGGTGSATADAALAALGGTVTGIAVFKATDAPTAQALIGGLIGESKIWSGPLLPPKYLWENGQAVSRTTYALLFDALCLVAVSTTTSGSPNIQIGTPTGLGAAFLEIIAAGMPIEGVGIAPGTTVSSAASAGVSAVNVVLSANASATQSGGAVRVIPHGNGDGSTTFSVPDSRGRANIGRDNMGGTSAVRVTGAVSGLTGTKLGAGGGDEHLQVHTHPIDGYSGNSNLTAGNQALNTDQFNTTFATGNNAGSGNSQNVQPSIVKNVIIYAGV